MRRTLRIATLPLLALALVSFAATGTAAASASTARSAAATGTCPSTGIEITQPLTFNPAVVSPGQDSTMSMTVLNCTSSPISTGTTEYGIFQGGTSGTIPPGCPAVDPILQSAAIAAGATYTASIGYEVFAGCTATSFQGTMSMSNSSTGAVLAQSTATLSITQTAPPSVCQVAYTVNSQWQGGFTASIAITDTGTVAVNGWKLTFVFGGDQKIADAWGASATQSGNTATLTNDSWDGSIAPGATLSSIGMIGTWTTSNLAPNGFTLNGNACSF